MPYKCLKEVYIGIDRKQPGEIVSEDELREAHEDIYLLLKNGDIAYMISANDEGAADENTG